MLSIIKTILEKPFINELAKERLNITGEYLKLIILYWFLILPKVMNELKWMGGEGVRMEAKCSNVVRTQTEDIKILKKFFLFAH